MAPQDSPRTGPIDTPSCHHWPLPFGRYYWYEALSGVPQQWEGEYYVANYTKTAGWGLGAWGANHVQACTRASSL